MISQALQQREQRLDDAASRLEQTDADAARWVAELRTELTALHWRPILGENTVMALARATRGLRLLDEGVVNKLSTAAAQLTNAEGIARSLEYSTSRLNR